MNASSESSSGAQGQEPAFDALLPAHRPCAVTIGNYDGLHLGHQSVLKQLLNAAADRGLESILLTLEPSPQEFFRGMENAPRIGSLDDKKRLAEQMFPALDHFVALPFNAKTAAIGAQEFVRDLLVGRLGMRYLTIGEDFRFGRDRVGDFALLGTESSACGFELEATPIFELDGSRVSSTRIRAALADGNVPEAEYLLGHPFEICAEVVEGDRRGREIGFPTANLDFPHNPPMRGVFTVTCQLGDRFCQGVANVGTRPTVDGTRLLIEAHLLDFAGDLYGQRMTVRFHQRLRAEQRFDSVDRLREQIGYDIEAAREFFADGST